MTIFNEEEQGFVNIVPADEAAFSPRAGFLQAFSNAYDLQAKAWGQFSLEVALRNHEQEMFQRIRAAGAEPPPSLNDVEDSQFLGGSLTLEGLSPGINSSRYLDAARALSGENTESEGTTSLLRDRNAKLRELAAKYPKAGIRTYDQLFADVRAAAAAAEERVEKTPLTFGGVLGDFTGGAAGSMRPSTDPLNFATIGVGGAGKSIATRVATEGGSQGAIETLNQFTGVQESRRLLGLDYGLSQAALQIGMTAAGGAALRGTGEAAAAGYRRWFQSTSADPAPTPQQIIPPPGPRPQAQPGAPLLALPAPRQRVRSQPVTPDGDLPDVMFAGEGQRPSLSPEVIEAGAPRGPIPEPQRRLPPPREDFGPIIHREAQRTGQAPLRPLDIGRLLSEETFNQVAGGTSRLGRKRIAEDVAAVAEQLESFEGPIPAQVRPSVDPSAAGKPGTAHSAQSGAALLVEAGASISARQADPDAFRVRANAERRVAKVEQRIEAEVAAARQASDSPKAAAAAEAHVRGELQPLLDRMELKLAQAQALVERAEAVSEGRFPRQGGDEPVDAPVPTQRAPDTAPDVRTDPTTAQARTDTTEIRQSTEHATKVVDEAVDGFRATVGRLLADEELDEIHLPSGKSLSLDGDTMEVPTVDGEGTRTVTIRQALRELNDDENVLRAVNTCSLPSRS